MDLGWILEVFGEDLASNLKTIRNIFDELLCLRTCVDDQGDEGQINGWMDGLINKMAIATLWLKS